MLVLPQKAGMPLAQGALKDFNTAVEMDPNSALALSYRGLFRLQGGPVLV